MIKGKQTEEEKAIYGEFRIWVSYQVSRLGGREGGREGGHVKCLSFKLYLG